MKLSTKQLKELNHLTCKSPICRVDFKTGFFVEIKTGL